MVKLSKGGKILKRGKTFREGKLLRDGKKNFLLEDNLFGKDKYF